MWISILVSQDSKDFYIAVVNVDHHNFILFSNDLFYSIQIVVLYHSVVKNDIGTLLDLSEENETSASTMSARSAPSISFYTCSQ